MLLDPECQPSPHSLHRLLCPVSLLLSGSLTLLFFGLLARKLGLQLLPMSYTNHIHALVQGQAAEVLTEGKNKKHAYLPQPFGTTASSVKEVSLSQFQVLSIQLSPLPVTTATQDCLGLGCERIEKKRRGSRGFLSTSSLRPPFPFLPPPFLRALGILLLHPIPLLNQRISSGVLSFLALVPIIVLSPVWAILQGKWGFH